jgi:phosphonate transport system substrate-binding protein
MLKTLFKSVTASAFMLIAFSTAVMAETFVFTAIPDQDETKLKARFTKIASYLSKELGVDVKYIRRLVRRPRPPFGEGFTGDCPGV